MKLYYKTGACSLAAHIALVEAGLSYEIEAVDLATKITKTGANFREINPKGAVPALKLKNGEILTEASVILQFIADQNPEAGLIPPAGSMERYRCQEWLNYIASEIHKGIGMLFGVDRLVKTDSAKAELREAYKAAMTPKLDFISQKLGTGNYLMGEQFTVTDAYMFTVVGWAKYVALDLSPWKNITDYMERVAQRPAVQKAKKLERG